MFVNSNSTLTTGFICICSKLGGGGGGSERESRCATEGGGGGSGGGDSVGFAPSTAERWNQPSFTATNTMAATHTTAPITVPAVAPGDRLAVAVAMPLLAPGGGVYGPARRALK